MGDWEVLLLEEVETWYLDLCEREAEVTEKVEEAIEALVAEGPTLGRPFVDRIKGSHLHNLKELRPTRGTTQFRILFIFDPHRQAVLLVAGDKTGNWKGWYVVNIPIAEERYAAWLQEQEHE